MQKFKLFTIGTRFKVHNTWNLSTEQRVNKILKTVKDNFLPTSSYGRLKKSFWDDVSKSLVYVYQNQEIKVRLNIGCNLNRGTWYSIDSVRINDEYVVCDENSYKPELELVESEN